MVDNTKEMHVHFSHMLPNVWTHHNVDVTVKYLEGSLGNNSYNFGGRNKESVMLAIEALQKMYESDEMTTSYEQWQDEYEA